MQPTPKYFEFRSYSSLDRDLLLRWTTGQNELNVANNACEASHEHPKTRVLKQRKLFLCCSSFIILATNASSDVVGNQGK